MSTIGCCCYKTLPRVFLVTYRMTGVGGRPEVIVEGSNDQKKWKAYEFLYKPGKLDDHMPIVGQFILTMPTLQTCITKYRTPAQHFCVLEYHTTTRVVSVISCL